MAWTCGAALGRLRPRGAPTSFPQGDFMHPGPRGTSPASFCVCSHRSPLSLARFLTRSSVFIIHTQVPGAACHGGPAASSGSDALLFRTPRGIAVVLAYWQPFCLLLITALRFSLANHPSATPGPRVPLWHWPGLCGHQSTQPVMSQEWAQDLAKYKESRFLDF